MALSSHQDQQRASRRVQVLPEEFQAWESKMCNSGRAMVAIVLFGLLVPGAAQGWTGVARHARIAQIEQLLDETEIETFRFEEKLTVENLLIGLAGRLSKGPGITLSIDRTALGDDAAKLAATTVRFRTTGTVSLRSALQDLLDQVRPQIEVDYAIRPTAVVLTRARLAARTTNYDIGEALRVDAQFLSDKDGLSDRLTTTRLAELLATNAGLRDWETIDVLNCQRLSVYAASSRQHLVATLIGSMTRLADLGVYMNARLYEVDQASYKTVVSPAVAGKNGDPAPVAIRVEKTVLEKVLKHVLVHESENIKLEPTKKAMFLARERYVPNLGLTGVSFTVRPEVSPDRRHLRLHLTQSIAELVRPEGAKGPDVPADETTIRKTTVSGSVDIRDGEAFLMPVGYRPPGEAAKDKVWVLVARPLIWIEAEERERGGTSRPRDVWDSTDWDELTRELNVRAKPLPATEDTKAILQAVLSDVLTNKDLAHSREFYGTDADKTILLSNTGSWEWPAGFRPELHGFKLVTSRPGPFAPRAKRNRVLGVRLDRFEPDAKTKGILEGPIEICLFNAGGTANGAVIGGCSVYYAPKRVGNKWAVNFLGAEDP